MRILTQKNLEIVNAIVTKGFITSGIGDYHQGMKIEYCELNNILWDTGANQSMVCQEVVDALHLQPLGIEYVEGVGSVIQKVEKYEVNLYIDDLRFKKITVLSGDIGDCNFIVGMDLICQGDFAITNKDGQTWFAFRHPSQDHIEFH